MNPNDLFAEALPLRRPWIVADSRLESKPGEPRRLHLVVALEEGCRRLACSECDASDCPIHDRVERQWKHLNFWQYETILSARVPRVKCGTCGVRQVSVPWAREGSGFTLLFEAMAMLLSNHMSVSEASGMLGEHDTRIWRVVSHYVDKAREACDWSGVRRVAVDEVSRKKGHVYATNFLDLDTGKLLFMAPGKDASTLAAFAQELARRGGSPGQIEELAMDMSKAFRKGAAEHFPGAKISFDRFHVMMLAGEALDAVRKEVARREGGLEKGAMWSLRGNASRLSESAAEQRRRLCRDYGEIGRAMGLREFLQDAWNYATCELAEEHLQAWVSWASRCRLEPFKKLARTIREHREGILNYYRNWTTSAAIESLHSKLQLARSRARGFRNFDYFRTIAYWIAGGLTPGSGLPTPIPSRL
jgi:transposase